jgi:hypothetical protein
MNSGAMSEVRQISGGHGMPSTERRESSLPGKMGGGRMKTVPSYWKNYPFFQYDISIQMTGKVTRNTFPPKDI